MNSLFVFLVVIVVGVCACPASADAGWISSGGAAHLLTENQSVTMQSEVVNIHVSKNLIKADCSFTFLNEGPACKVRMGFPDEASEQMDDPWDDSPRGGFLSYQPYVDAKEVKSEVVRGKEPDVEYIVWHANEVEFGAHETRTIRDIYTLFPGSGVVSDKGYIAKTLSYILHTASSWHGKIERADIIITFDKDALPEPLLPVSLSTLQSEIPNDPGFEAARFDWAHATPGTFLYRASKAPGISGQTIRFQFRDLRPSDKDDIVLYYGRMNWHDGNRYGAMVQRKWQQKHAGE
jgi:hypothetical protein